MTTTRLYWDDPLLLSCEAEVLELRTLGGRPALVVPATCVYPEAGGQLADRGEVRWEGGRAAIVDVQEADDGTVLHALEAAPGSPLPAVGATVSLSVDEARRRDHMSQHSGQHLLSRALLDRAGGETISSRLGETVCTIDTPLSRLADAALDDAEALVNAIVLEDRPVRALRPSPDELAGMKLRREPKVSSSVRVVDMDGFDLSPCGGTHVLRTGQVGPVRILGVERYKGGHRISFVAGARAIADAKAKDRVLAGLARDFSCGPTDVPAGVERLRAELKAAERAASALRERLAVRLSAELLAGAGAPPVVAVALADEGADFLRALAARLCETAGVIAILAAPGPDGIRLLVQRGEGAAFDCGASLRRLAVTLGGRGGGRPDRAEGLAPPGGDLGAALEAERRVAQG